MSEAHRRPKRPEFVRQMLISAAAELLAAGLPLSMSTVAEQAGVSKGAVQHHFGTRDELIKAMYETCLAEFEAGLRPHAQRESGPGAAARAYVRAGCEQFAENGAAEEWRALLVASVADRSLAGEWAQWVAQSRAQDPPGSVNELIMRLAADGLWLADLLGTYSISADDRARVIDALTRLNLDKPASE